jgi:hypothetical protein
MREFNSFEGFATLVAGPATEVEHKLHETREHVGQLEEDEAKRVLGTYAYDWPPVAASTVARKATGDSPLLETGELKNSIEHQVDGHEVDIGSNLEKAVWMELGTATIPPRSFLAQAAVHKVPELVEHLGQAVLTQED